MIIPSIDLMNGSTVQLVGGKEKKLDLGDPLPFAEQFSVAGEIAVVDLDAALGRGSNTALIEKLVRTTPCRVGGGIRSSEAALSWLDRGATKVVLGTAADPQILRQLPRERLVAALDAVNGEVVVEGWQKNTGRSIFERIEELRPYVGGFLVTSVEREGRMQGVDLALAQELVKAAGSSQVTIAGGVTTSAEIAALDRMGAEAQVGMALYTGRLTLADAIAAPLQSERADGLWPTIVADEAGVALGLVWSSQESLQKAIELRRGVYYSRKRGLWIKGETSGATQDLRRIDLDCDRDALRFTVRQNGAGFCHLERSTCFGPYRGLAALEQCIRSRMDVAAPPKSYTKRLLSDTELLNSKLREEAAELAAAADATQAAAEAADVFYFALTVMARQGVSLAEVAQELDRRALRVTRRAGDAKSSGQRA